MGVFSGWSSRIFQPVTLILVPLAAALGLPAADLWHSVRAEGATGDGVTLDTKAIQAAIDKCAREGGGTVVLPAGRYLAGTIRFRSNVTLHLEAGATILGTDDLSLYQKPAGERDWYLALILAEDVHDVALTGHGTIDGRKVFNPEGEERMRGPHAALFFKCRDVTIRDVNFVEAANYAVILRASLRVTVDGITAKGGWDGLNIHDSRNVTVSNSQFYTGDDCLAGAYWENVTVTNCILNTSCNAIRTGGRNVLIENTLIYGPGEYEHRTSHRTNMIAGFQILPHRDSARHVVEPGPVDNMVLSNVSMVNVRTPVFVAYGSEAAYGRDSFGVGRIIINNLTATGVSRTPFYVAGTAGDPMGSLIVNSARITYTGGATEEFAHHQGRSPMSTMQAYAFYLRHIRQVELRDVRVDYEKPDTRPALLAQNVGLLELDRFQAKRESDGAPPLLFENLRSLIVNGRTAPAAAARIRSVDAPEDPVYAGEPFRIGVRVENAGDAGLAEIPLRAGGLTMRRSVWLEKGESAPVRFMDVVLPDAGDKEIRSEGPMAKLTVLPKPAGRAVSEPYRSFHNTEAVIQQLDGGFYIMARGRSTVLDRADEYGAVYRERALASGGAVAVRMENPDGRSGWGGHAGIIVRDDIAAPGRSAGYLILTSSACNGTSLQWDSDGDGRIDRHTELDGHTRWPHWLKLERNGNRFTGYASVDGKTWDKTGEADAPGASGARDAGLFCHQSSARFTGLRWE